MLCPIGTHPRFNPSKMSFHKTYINLPEEDRELFREIQQSALLPTLAEPGVGDLARRQRAFRKQEAIQMLDPYADILEQQIMPLLLAKKEAILAKLVSSPQDGYFYVDVCEWNTVQYACKGSELREHIASLAPQEKEWFLQGLKDRNDELKQRGWTDSRLSVKKMSADDGLIMLRPQKIERIMRKSNLGWRIAQALGPNFRPEIVLKAVSHIGAPRSKLDYIAFKGVLTLVYCPLGLERTLLKEMLATVKRQKERRAAGLLWTPQAEEVVCGGIRWYTEE
jgi:hypothetical protein